MRGDKSSGGIPIILQCYFCIWFHTRSITAALQDQTLTNTHSCQVCYRNALLIAPLIRTAVSGV